MGDYDPPQLKSSEFVVRDATEGFAEHDLFDVLSRPAETGQSPTAASVGHRITCSRGPAQDEGVYERWMIAAARTASE